MASVANDGKGWHIQFVAPDDNRKTLCLGRVAKKTAESIRVHVGALWRPASAAYWYSQAPALG